MLNSVKYSICSLISALWALTSCTFPTTPATTPATTAATTGTTTTAASTSASIAQGADIGWLSLLEAEGYSWVDSTGATTDCVALLQGHGVDSIRLRVMINPTKTISGGGLTDTADVVAMAEHCASLGITKFMVDFHFSDTWADAGDQKIPAAWEGHTLTQLSVDLSSHVTAVLTALKNGSPSVVPSWVQIGNEEDQGILWDSPSTSSNGGNNGFVTGTSGWTNLVTLLNSAYSAVKTADPSAQVVIHLDNGGNNSQYRWWFDNYKANGGKWDVVGMSFYPYWQPSSTVTMLSANMNDMVSRYGKPVMVCEVGGRYDDPAGTKTLVTDVKAAVASVTGGNGLGLFYWEPESNPTGTGGYLLGAASVHGTNQFQLTSALGGFQ